MPSPSPDASSSVTADDETSGPPVAFGKYRLHQRLARGGMGEVYRASLVGEFGFEKPLVIKTILPQFARKPRFIELFAEEAKTAVALSHGNIVPIYELGRADDTFYIVMGYVDGPSVAGLLSSHRLRNEPMPVPVALSIVRGVLTGLAYAHTARPDRPAVVHRDITPRNVMLESSGQVRIVDFGIARPADEHATMRAGSTGYVAPEQMRAETVDPRADVFSVGCLLFEMLTLQRAFPREGVWTQPLLDDVPQSLREPLQGALALDPADRPEDARALLERLGPALAEYTATFSEADLADHLRASFPDGDWKHAAPARAVTPSTGVVPTPVTFATRLTTVSDVDAPPVDGDAEAAEPSSERAAAAPSFTGASDASRAPRIVWALGAAAVAALVLWLFVGREPSESKQASSTELGGAAGSEHEAAEDAEAPTTRAAPQPESAPIPAPPPTTTLIVTTPGATVLVDDRPITGTSPFSIPIPATGSSMVTVQAPGHQPWQHELSAAQPTLPAVELQATEVGRGFVQVLAPAVPWAEVTIDGRPKGVTPTRKIELAAGPHKVVVRCVPDVCPEPKVLARRTVEISPGETSRVTAR